jgi:hypothetical protein
MKIFWMTAWATVVAVAGAGAQTITPQSLPPVGASLRYATVNPTSVTVGASGTGRVWSFSNVQVTGEYDVRWLGADNPRFPQANIESDYLAPAVYDYLSPPIRRFLPEKFFRRGLFAANETGVKLVANVGLTDTLFVEGDTVVFVSSEVAYEDDAMWILPLPCSFGTSVENRRYRQEIRARLLNRPARDQTLRIVRNITQSITADAAGRLSTPYKSYNKTVRVRTVVSETDSLFIGALDGEETALVYLTAYPIRYVWYDATAPGADWEPMSIVVDSTGTPLSAAFFTGALPIARFSNYSFDHDSTRIFENSGVVTLGIELTRPSTQIVTVKYRTYSSPTPSPRVARPGLDYVPVDATLAFQPGEMSKSISIAILADSILEDDRWFAVEIYDPVGAAIGTLNLYPIVIIDNQRPFVDFTRLDTMVAENVGTVFVPIRLSFPISEPISVSLETRRGTAIPLEDYRPVNITIAIPPGSYEDIGFPVTILDDDHLEGTVRYFTLRIAGVSPNARLGDNDTIQIQIADDDFRPNLQFVGQRDTVVREATNIHGTMGNIVRARVALSFPNPYPVSFTYSTVDGTAVGGEDFERRTRTRVVLPMWETQTEIELPIYNDLTPEPVEDFALIIDCLSVLDCSISPNAQPGVNLRYDVTLIDNEPSRRFENRSFPMKVYPNPTTVRTSVHLGADVSNPTFSVTDVAGKTVKLTAEAADDNEYWLNVQRLPAGFYTLTVESGKRRATTKLVVTD